MSFYSGDPLGEYLDHSVKFLNKGKEGGRPKGEVGGGV